MRALSIKHDVVRMSVAEVRPRQFNGFTLIEIIVVLALLGLIATMLPQGLDGLYKRSSHQVLVQQTVGAARECALLAQRQQRSVQLGSKQCPIAEQVVEAMNAESDELSLPVFHADGTASHTSRIRIEDSQEPVARSTVVVIDKLTANVSLAPSGTAL